MFSASDAKKLTELKEKQFILDNQKAINEEILKCEKEIRNASENRYLCTNVKIKKELVYYVYHELNKRGFQVSIYPWSEEITIRWY